MQPTLSILLPTIGRATLARALQSIKEQKVGPGDEVIVIGDGDQPAAQSAFHCAAVPGIYVSVHGPAGDWGHTPRNLVMPRARGDYLLHIDDDDCYVPGALEAIRGALSQNPGRPHLFRMRLGSGGELWKTPVLSCGNVSTQMFVHPNRPETFGTWVPKYGGDCDFICGTVSKSPELVWREEVIAVRNP